jgi:hypothetical protein
MKNPELEGGVAHQIGQLEDIRALADGALKDMWRSQAPTEAQLLAYNERLALALHRIKKALQREPPRVYGGGLDQPSP